MPATKQPRTVIAPNYTGPRLFGAPVGDFSVLQTLLITVATGFISFFASTFVAIMSLLTFTGVTGRKVDFAVSYRWVGLPVGILMLLTAAVYLGSLLAGRMRRSASPDVDR